MLGPFISLFNLRWTNQPYLHPLPEHITRTFISTSVPKQDLELLSISPLPEPSPSTSPPPILLLHGGFGSAAVFIPFLTFFQKYYPSRHGVYAVSLRGHGASYSLSYLQHVYGTTISDLSSDLILAIDHITNLEGRPPIVVAHSSGGGLLQYTLSQSPSQLPGIVTLSSVPTSGNLPIYLNWALHDPWFSLRLIPHLFHAASPLSTATLVRNVFFGSAFHVRDDEEGGARISKFMQYMTPYESLTWPIQMMKGFWNFIVSGGKQGKWLKAEDVVANGITGWKGKQETEDRVCVMLGDEDKLMDLAGQRMMASEYREAIRQLSIAKKIDVQLEGDMKNSHDGTEKKFASETRTDDGVLMESAGGVRLVVVRGAGHHIQNDVQWERAAEAIVDFASQL